MFNGRYMAGIQKNKYNAGLAIANTIQRKTEDDKSWRI
jgi:hypothetical protein